MLSGISYNGGRDVFNITVEKYFIRCRFSCRRNHVKPAMCKEIYSTFFYRYITIKLLSYIIANCVVVSPEYNELVN